MKACILISTFEKYRRLAEWTAARIAVEWEDHPPIFFAGLDADGGACLGFHGESSDWMSVNRDAVILLRQQGYTHAYLILDDHPPVGCCNAKFLNEELPGLAVELDAAYIGLLGYGQHRHLEGKILCGDYARLERSHHDYRWKFSLHPGFWNLESLESVLNVRMSLYLGKNRTPWNFERHRDSQEFSLQFPSFRVHGASSIKGGRNGFFSLTTEAILRFFGDCSLFIAKQKGGQQARDKEEIRIHWIYGHYQGPYPLFWSGCMRQGKINRDFETWVRHHGNERIQSDWEQAKSKCFLDG
jgi:hypothetical protein